MNQLKPRASQTLYIKDEHMKIWEKAIKQCKKNKISLSAYIAELLKNDLEK